MSCKYCRREKAIDIINIKTDKKYEDLSFNVFVNEDGINIESNNLPEDGLYIEVKYCPFCGQELDIKDRLSKNLGYRSYSHLKYNLDNFTDLEMKATNYYFKSNGIEDLLD